MVGIVRKTLLFNETQNNKKKRPYSSLAVKFAWTQLAKNERIHSNKSFGTFFLDRKGNVLKHTLRNALRVSNAGALQQGAR